MPPAFGFQSGRRCGPVDACSTPCSRSRAYAASMSRTMIATCWNQRSLLARCRPDGPAARREILGQLDLFVAERAAATTRSAGAEDACELLVLGARRLRRPTPSSNGEHAREEVDRAVHVRHRHADASTRRDRKRPDRAAARRRRQRSAARR